MKNFEPHDWIDPTLKPKRRMARASQLAIAATQMALADAGLSAEALRRHPSIPIVMGVSTAAMDIRERPPRPWSAVAGIPHATASAVAFGLRFQARLLTVSNGCASGLDALALAAQQVRDGHTELALAGSADAALTAYVFKCFESSRKMSMRNAEPHRASRPFDRDRDGGLAAEAGAMLIVESLEHALARGATLYAELGGYGTLADTPDTREGEGIEKAMRSALANEGCRPEQIDHVSCHAPSDPHMDRIEVQMIKQVFGPHAYRVPVTSIKGHTGNPMAVGGLLQAAAAALAMRHGLVPPTANLEHPDPQCDLDHVPGAARQAELRRILINTHGFGRGNSSLVLKRADGMPGTGVG